ncbi:IS200/IS605 family transposase [Micromonospora sp. NPDC048999]|uniref:IS200/IS605 family transposase n=1 Tax=Micromonospora sp. NPDC048999 TaxID=3155391 RepID=UPI0033F61C48
MSPRWAPDTNVRRGRSVVFNLHVHLVFVTKYRRDVLNDAMLTRCEQVMADVCAGMGAELAEFNGEDDHVHLLVRYPPKLAISTLVNSLKGVSAHYLRKEFTGRINRHIMHGHLWSPSYFAASCGGAPLEIVKQYIANQKHPDP